MRPSALARISSAAAGLVALAAGVAPAHGAVSVGSSIGAVGTVGRLLDEPPKLYTFKLDDPSASHLALLDAFRDAAVEPSSGFRDYLAGPWSRRRGQPWSALAWASPVVSVVADEPASSPDEPAPPVLDEGSLLSFDFGEGGPHALSLSLVPSSGGAPTSILKTPGAIFASNGFDGLWSLPPSKPVPNWRCRRRPVLVMRYGGESDSFPLVRCDGSVAPQAFDRLTLMARETGAPRPGDLLPDEPDPEVMARGEWAPGVRLVHPRLLWALQRVADAFPWRAIYVFSGYRHDPSGAPPKPGTHHSMHSEARALDIYVMGIPGAALFQVCHKLEDVGCGFYPNNKFVHLDVRRPGSGHPFWIDVSGPGEPSRYVDAWPGVVESGGMVWDAAPRHGDVSHPGSDASCTTRKIGP
jgi:Peptidase M15